MSGPKNGCVPLFLVAADYASCFFLHQRAIYRAVARILKVTHLSDGSSFSCLG